MWFIREQVAGSDLFMKVQELHRNVAAWMAGPGHNLCL